MGGEKYVDASIHEANTPIRRSGQEIHRCADPGRESISVRSYLRDAVFGFSIILLISIF